MLLLRADFFREDTYNVIPYQFPFTLSSSGCFDKRLAIGLLLTTVTIVVLRRTSYERRTGGILRTFYRRSSRYVLHNGSKGKNFYVSELSTKAIGHVRPVVV